MCGVKHFAFPTNRISVTINVFCLIQLVTSISGLFWFGQWFMQRLWHVLMSVGATMWSPLPLNLADKFNLKSRIFNANMLCPLCNKYLTKHYTNVDFITGW